MFFCYNNRWSFVFYKILLEMCVFMNYIVFDMEWNQPISKNSYPYVKIGNQLSNEIIQIGAYKLNDEFKIMDSFVRYVRPSFYKKINRNVLKITELDTEKILSGDDFISAFEDFRDWCGNDFSFFTWGTDDISVMKQNISFYSLSADWIKSWYNLQTIFANQVFGDSAQRALSVAMEHFNIDQNEKRHLHDALNDAYYTSLVFQQLDIKQGLSSYSAPSDFKLLCVGLTEKKIGLFKTKELAFCDKRVSEVNCPLCGNALTCIVPWFNNNTRYNFIGSCRKHGEFISRIRFEKKANDFLYAFKNVKKVDVETLNRIKQKNFEREQRKRLWSQNKRQRRRKSNLWRNIFNRKSKQS